jgi:sulfate transport system ATP-binding protein
LVTHDQDEALELANEVVVMHHGRIEQIGTPAQVYDRPASPFVAGFIGSANVLEGRVERGHLVFGEHVLPMAARHLEDGAMARAYVRPIDVRVAGDGIGSNDTHRAIVERINNLGASSKVQFRLSDGQSVVAELSNERLPVLEPGREVMLDLRNVKVFERETEDAPGSVEVA